MVALITSSSFEKLNFLILSKKDSSGNIEKTMIFVNSIKKYRIMVLYLQTFLPDRLKNRGKDIIKFFFINFRSNNKDLLIKKIFHK